MSNPINVNLPDVVAELLEKWAGHGGRPTTTNLAAYIIERTMQEAESQGKFPTVVEEVKRNQLKDGN